ncbi:MAG TPA: isoprenylcysteine carboxylmethyltransferase family protein [Candidatus Eisenbacteria bacterium]|jgi:protein-S-isoprenylcysteine O-methyltransferase Ste14|nr:isoprenylcysteine carboxylmethyltransferase family protein [Candidatus Eisenbacteria bacterium]
MTEPVSTERGADVHFPPPLVFAGLVLLGVALRYATGPVLHVPEWIKLAGIALLLASLGAGFWARSHHVRTGQNPAPWKPAPELILQGPYRFTRNPMYVGLAGVQFGLGLALGNPWIALLAPCALLIVHFMAVLPEEKYLAEKFGTDYLTYLSTVRRYL